MTDLEVRRTPLVSRKLSSPFTKAAIDIKADRANTKINRLDPAYLTEWRKDFNTAKADYLSSDINRIQFSDCLQSLGYRDDALKAELLDAERDKNDPTHRPPRRFFRYETK